MGEAGPLLEAGESQGGDQFSSVAQSCLTLCDPVDCSAPGLPVLHQLPELAQTHVHGVSNAMQPSHSSVNERKSSVRWAGARSCRD